MIQKLFVQKLQSKPIYLIKFLEVVVEVWLSSHVTEYAQMTGYYYLEKTHLNRSLSNIKSIRALWCSHLLHIIKEPQWLPNKWLQLPFSSFYCNFSRNAEFVLLNNAAGNAGNAASVKNCFSWYSDLFSMN